MPVRFSILLLGGVLALLGAASAQSSQLPFSIGISAERPVVKAGSDVFIQIQMVNTSNHDVDCTRVPTNASDRAYQYDIRDSRGNLAEKMTLAPKHPEIKETFSIWPCVLKPGESTSKDDNLISKLYDLSRPGKYVVQVSRFISGARKEEGVVKSNTITITVTP
jgi:hypothetical protein